MTPPPSFNVELAVDLAHRSCLLSCMLPLWMCVYGRISDASRIVLIVDVWHPDLSKQEVCVRARPCLPL